MALKDILDSIVADADKRIADAQAEHTKRMKEMREENEQSISFKRTQILQQTEQKKRELKEKSESQARMIRSKTLLSKKQEYMDALYSEVLQELLSLPADKMESFIKKCFEHIKGSGTIHAAKQHEELIKKHLPKDCKMGTPINAKGGFRFVSDKEEHDFTFEFLVENVLRPKTEVSVAHSLFPASH